MAPGGKLAGETVAPIMSTHQSPATKRSRVCTHLLSSHSSGCNPPEGAIGYLRYTKTGSAYASVSGR